MYYRLVIAASSPTTTIWLADDEGHLVQTEVGELDTYVSQCIAPDGRVSLVFEDRTATEIGTARREGGESDASWERERS